MINIDWNYEATRSDLITAIAKKIEAKSYLEIGCASNDNFDKIQIENKIGVDPERGGTLRMTSDDFFEVCSDKFDLIFVDGLHHVDQVVKDINNSLECLNDGGVIVIHDCLPVNESMQMVPVPMGIHVWTGDVWKSAFYFNDKQEVDICVVKIDMGCGIIRKRKPSSSKVLENADFWLTSTYQDYVENYNKLPLKSYEEALNWV